ncbi:MAG: organic solvent tolerance protein [Roseovarius sp.]|nr:organic solvent tolerance protein [Roseovarius sp.]MBK46177.1 organic solvent tolerance protein [Roseovarius sp.]
MRQLLSAMLAVFALAVPAAAQEGLPDPAMLVADEVVLTADRRLIARGNVEALYQGRRLTAREIVYDRATDRLTITGPLSLSEGSETVILADSAALDRDLSNGILRGARIVMHEQLQLAAHRMRRTDARLNELYKAAVTSCRVCETGRPPLWQIRSERLVHDEQKNRLYFYNAQLRVLDTPVLYLPRLSLPDGSVKRATGFLTPSVVNSSLLGTGVRVPYFITLGDHRDLTVAPFYATNSKRLELRYRQAFRRGEIEFNGAVADDDFSADDTRGYVFGTGRFELPRDFVLRFGVEYSSDDTFLLDHDFSDKDRLQSGVSVERARRDEHVRLALDHFRSLRVGESNSTLPRLAANAEYRRRLFPRWLGGEVRLTALAHGHERNSGLGIDGPDPDIYADGRDMARFTAEADWLRQWVLPGGVLATVEAGIALDHFELRQIGMTASSEATEITPRAAVQLRWPLQKVAPGGAAHVIEPVLQLAWSGGSNPDIPNDENTVIEFDEGNLFNISRFVAPDRRERGVSGAVGLSYTRVDPAGWEGRLALGQVYREDRLREPDGQPSFASSSGLSERTSDLLLAGQVRTRNGLVITARGLFDEVFEVTKAEARGSWRNARTDIGATYIWLDKDPRENRPDTISEWAIDGSYRFADHWTASGEWRFDTSDQRSIRAGAGITYTNECVEITFSVSRRFTSSTILEPETNFGLVIGLRGFSAGTRDSSYTRKCRTS